MSSFKKYIGNDGKTHLTGNKKRTEIGRIKKSTENKKKFLIF
jgi:hypothetical protein